MRRWLLYALRVRLYEYGGYNLWSTRGQTQEPLQGPKTESWRIHYGSIGRNVKGYGTGNSQAVTHPSTNPACACLTSEIERDRVYSGEYGRIRQDWYSEVYKNDIQAINWHFFRTFLDWQTFLLWPIVTADIVHSSMTRNIGRRGPRFLKVIAAK